MIVPFDKPLFLYHGTSSYHIQGIIEKGLYPTSESQIQTNYEESYMQSFNNAVAVYLIDKWHYAYAQPTIAY